MAGIEREPNAGEHGYKAKPDQPDSGISFDLEPGVLALFHCVDLDLVIQNAVAVELRHIHEDPGSGRLQAFPEKHQSQRRPELCHVLLKLHGLNTVLRAGDLHGLAVGKGELVGLS